MAIEAKDGAQISTYREVVHDWVKRRPTLKHTPEKLMFIVYGEYNELVKATNQDNRVEELGDVLFSLLALDDREGPINMGLNIDQQRENNIEELGKLFGKIGKNIRHFKTNESSGKRLTTSDYENVDRAYNLIFGLCRDWGANFNEMFNSTNKKNEIHYPSHFFDSRTPFVNPDDAINCLRFLRKINKNANNLNTFWSALGSSIAKTMAFYDLWWETKVFRRYLKASLIQEMYTRNDAETTKVVRRILTKGRWDTVPLQFNGKYIYQK